jgi:hypothetical protein
VLWLNPGNNNTFPSGLIEALTLHNNGAMPFEEDPTETVQSRMRKQIQADALQPLRNEDDEEAAKRGSSVPPVLVDHFPPELLEETTQFLRLQVGFNCTIRVLPGDFVPKGTGSSSIGVDLPPRQTRILLLVWSRVRECR